MDGVDSTYLEEKFRENQETLANILRTASDAIIILDDAGRIRSFNAAAERMFGCSEQDATGTSLEIFVPPRFHAAHRLDFERWRQRDRLTGSVGRLSATHGSRKDGHEFPCEAWVSAQNLGGQQRFTVFVRDMTEQEQAEQELHRRIEFET